MIPGAILVLFYTVYAMTERATGMNLFLLSVYTGREFVQWMLGYLIVSALLIVVGGILNYRYPERNR